MKKRLANVSPLQCGIVLAALYFCLSLLFIPFLLLAAVVSAHNPQITQQQGNPFASLGLVFVILVPVFYTIAGFIGGVIAALVYNLIAKMTGGLEFTTVDVASNVPPAINYPTR